jgi:hypothetical protein
MLNKDEEVALEAYIKLIRETEAKGEPLSGAETGARWLALKLKQLNELLKQDRTPMINTTIEGTHFPPAIIRNVENKPAVVAYWEDSTQTYRCVVCRDLCFTIDLALDHVKTHFPFRRHSAL